MKNRKINSILSILFIFSTLVMLSKVFIPIAYLYPIATAIIATIHYLLRKGPEKMEMIFSFNIFSFLALILPVYCFLELISLVPFYTGMFNPILILTALTFMFSAPLAIATGLMALKRLKSKKGK